MVAWYPLDEGANAPIYQDIAGTVQNAGVSAGSNAPWAVPGMVNGAQYFFGSGSNYISVPHDPELNFGSGDFSLDAWVNFVDCSQNPAIGSNAISPIVEKYDATSNVGFSFFTDQQRIHLVINGVQFSTLPLGLSPNTWYHVAVVVDRNANPPAGTFYLNGSPVGTFTPPAGSVDNNEPLQIGKCFLVANPLTDPYCEGAVDELELFNVAVSSAEIAAIAAAGSAGKCQPNLGRLKISSSPGFSQLQFTVTDPNGHVVFQTSAFGGLTIDTGCTLFCNVQYKVEAQDLVGQSTFTPKQVTVPCCPQEANVFFP